MHGWSLHPSIMQRCHDLRRMRHLLLLPLLAIACVGSGQQVPDTLFDPGITDPRYAMGKGPRVQLDEGHHNFHTLDGRYLVFGKIVAADGYQVSPYRGRFEAEKLRATDVLVIANALNERNVEDWSLPNPSAFDSNEIAAVRNWVNEGGSLFLIADHMPLAGCAQDLAHAFGFEYLNCFAKNDRGGPYDRFYQGNGLETAHEIINGSATGHAVDTVTTFTGSAIRIPSGAQPLIRLSADFSLLEPKVAWEIDKHTPKQSGAGWYQGACMTYGKGRLVFFGEAAMFSGQLAGKKGHRMGLNVPEAADNVALLRNIMAWLTGAQAR
jgi:hypothetical protein